jgi:hypothetical protein
MVGVTGLEPATSRSRTVRSTSLSYTPPTRTTNSMVKRRMRTVPAHNTGMRICNHLATDQKAGRGAFRGHRKQKSLIQRGRCALKNLSRHIQESLAIKTFSSSAGDRRSGHRNHRVAWLPG